ncbi:MAG: ABC transporter substrate-binding protein [Candidatus Heimdallarchaeota archaeon]
MKKIQNKMAVWSIIVLLFVSGISIVNSNKVVGDEPFFTMILKFKDGVYHHANYGNLIKQQLARIGINVDIIITGGPWTPLLLSLRTADIGLMELQTTNNADPDFTGVYNENGSLNVFGYHTSMDSDDCLGPGKNEWYMRQGNLIMPPNSEERIEHYWEWEQYLMTDLLLCQPLFNKKSFVQTWNNLIGYNYSKGILQSWGDMNWSGTHTGQTNTSELVVADQQWDDLNPLFLNSGPTGFISSLTLDPLFWIEPDKSIQPHLATDLIMLNDTHARITLREGIKWQPDPDGNFTNEFFDAEDVYFTLKSFAEISNDYYLYSWIEDLEIIDPYTIDIFIDEDQSTPENEPYNRFLERLSVKIIPEHYLNQTQILGLPDIFHPSWNIFNTQCFGTGLFVMDSYIEGTETTLTINSDCWWLNNTITSDTNLDWANRFGDFTNILQQLRIKILKSYEEIFAFRNGEIDISPPTDVKPTITSEFQTHSKRT